jgi:excisionase family DNA binding protein
MLSSTLTDSQLLLPADLATDTLANPGGLTASHKMPSTEPWVSVDELAQHLGVAKDSVYRWIERKGLPARKVGKLWKFKLSEVDEWVRAGGAGQSVDREGGR